MVKSPFLITEVLRHVDRAINSIPSSLSDGPRVDFALECLKVARRILRDYGD